MTEPSLALAEEASFFTESLEAASLAEDPKQGKHPLISKSFLSPRKFKRYPTDKINQPQNPNNDKLSTHLEVSFFLLCELETEGKTQTFLSMHLSLSNSRSLERDVETRRQIN